MMGIDSVLQRIRDFTAQRGQKARISAETGILLPNLSLIKHADWNPRASTIRVLDAAVTKLSAETPDTEQPQD